MIIIPANTISGGYEVDNSLRFNDGSTDYLSKTFGSAGNRKIYTISFWIKRSNISEENFLISSSTTIGSNNRDAIRFESGDSLRFFFNGASSGDLKTNALFRDVSAWYHILASVDTSQSTASNRVKLYINGVQETSFATETYPSQNYEGNVNNNDTHRIGMDTSNTNNGYNGYMAEVCLIDGQQLTLYLV